MFIRLLTAAAESMLISFTMFGVAHRRKSRPVYQHALFILLNMVMLYFLDLNAIWEVMFFFAVMLGAFTGIFEVDLRTVALGGVTTYVFLTVNMLATALFSLLIFNEKYDYRLLFQSAHLSMHVFTIVFAVILIIMFNMFIAMPRHKARTRVSYGDLTVRINLILSFILIVMLSWNLSYLYKNWENVSAVPGLSDKIIILVIFASAMVGGMIFVVNRYLMKSMLLFHVSETSQKDVMTGTLNREAGLAILKDMMKASRETGAKLTICFVDINNLKFVNDKFGHTEGDKLISIVSSSISENLRGMDIVARMGGDEFIVIFAGCDLSKAREIWGRILEKFKKINLSGELNFPVGISSGFVEYDPEKHTSVKTLIREADQKMYTDKRLRKSHRNYK